MQNLFISARLEASTIAILSSIVRTLKKIFCSGFLIFQNLSSINTMYIQACLSQKIEITKDIFPVLQTPATKLLIETYNIDQSDMQVFSKIYVYSEKFKTSPLLPMTIQLTLRAKKYNSNFLAPVNRRDKR